jgi:hypothetical protein
MSSTSLSVSSPMYQGLKVAFALVLEYFKAFKEVDLSEGGFLDHTGEHEGGESAERPRSVRKLLKTVSYQGLIFQTALVGERV